MAENVIGFESEDFNQRFRVTAPDEEFAIKLNPHHAPRRAFNVSATCWPTS